MAEYAQQGMNVRNCGRCVITALSDAVLRSIFYVRGNVMEQDMTKGSPFRLIIRFMIPIILGNIFQMLYNVMDTVIVGRFVGVQALAAVGATGIISFLIIGFMQGLALGFTVLTSQRFGAGDEEGVKKSVGNSYLLTAVMVVIMTAGSVAIMEWLLTVMQTPADIFEMSRTYITIICLGMGFNILYNLLSDQLRAVGNSKTPLYFLVIAAVLNIVLDLVLIIFFDMGVAGVALATIASQGVSGFLCLLYIIKKVPALRIRMCHLKPDTECIKSQLSLGIPMALQCSITAIGAIMVQTALNMLGSTVVAAYTVAGKVEQLATQALTALGATIGTFTAQNFGIKNFKRIRRGALIAFRIAAVYSVAALIVLELALPWLVGMFVTGEIGEVVQYVRIYVTICGSCFLPLAMIYIYRNAMQGCGHGFIPMMGGVVELVCRAIVAVIAAWFSSYAGVCCANAGAWLGTGFFIWIFYRRMMKKLEKE